MKVFGISHAGAVRKENQDCFRFDAPRGTELVSAVLCDGIGGAQAGSVASAMAADAFMSHAANSLDESSTAEDMQAILAEAVNYANIKVYDRSFSDFACMGMGSTLVGLLMNSRSTLVANVGDSRAYYIHRGTIQQITTDHSLVEELVQRGRLTRDEAKRHPQKNIITRAVGVESTVKCDIFRAKAAPGSSVLLCSDGLSNLVSDGEILTALKEHRDCETAARLLLALALERGAPDNVTVVIAQR